MSDPKNGIRLTEAEANALQVACEPGWTGVFSRSQAPHALFPNDSRVSKFKNEIRDTTLAGMQGTVLGSMYHPTLGFGYFVEWDDKPRVAVFVVGWKIGRAPSHGS